MIAGADGRDPRIILFKSETAERAVARNQEEREQKDGRGKAERDPTMVRLFRSRGKTIDDGRSRTDYRPGDSVPIVLDGQPAGTIPVSDLIP